MGAWGHGPFDNDAALDLIAQLAGAGPAGRAAAVHHALAASATADGYLDYDDASEALAAAAIVALARGPIPGVTEVPDEVDADTIEFSDELRALAVRAIDRVASPDSEWLDLWTEGSDSGNALTMVAALRSALLKP
jgi:hypothetical protein